jgi:hypothetical protein
MTSDYIRIALTASSEQVNEARESMIEQGRDEGHDWDEVVEFVAGLSTVEVVRRIDRNWSGGWSQFVRDIVPVEVD